MVLHFTDEEIYQATSQLGKWKSLDPDGIPIKFYVDHYDIVGHDIKSLIYRWISSSHQLHLL